MLHEGCTDGLGESRIDKAGAGPDLSVRGNNSIWGRFDVVLPDYNDQQGRCALATVTLTPICYCSCRAKNNLEPASKSKNKQEQVDKQTVHRPFQG